MKKVKIEIYNVIILIFLQDYKFKVSRKKIFLALSKSNKKIYNKKN